MERFMRNLTIFPLAALLAVLIASAPAARSQSAKFIVSQHGKSVGTASFNFTASPNGYDSTSLVIISMKGLDYSLSKTENLSTANHLRHVQLSAAVNGSAVNVTAVPETKFAHASVFVLDISANGKTTTTRLPQHSAAVFLPDFDPGALETLLVLAVARNNSDLWAIIPKKDGSIEPIQLATYADEKGTLNGNPVIVHHLVATIADKETDLFSGPENQLLQAEFPQIGYALIRKGFVLTPSAKPGVPPAQPSSVPPAQQNPVPPAQQPPAPPVQQNPAYPPVQPPPPPEQNPAPPADENPPPAAAQNPQQPS
jgi:hypothetical protein